MVTSQSILRIATISCISLVVFVLFPSSIANVAVAQEYITVTTTVDELYDNEFCSLREAVESANFGIPILGCQVDIAANAKTSLSPDEWVIDVPAGTYVLDIAGAGEDDNVTGDLDFTVTYGYLEIVGEGKDVTIIEGLRASSKAQNAALDPPPPKDRLLHVGPGADVRVKNLTMRNGYAEGEGNGGGGILNEGTLTLEDVKITECECGGGNNGGGGAVLNMESVMTAKRSEFRNNRCTVVGSAISQLMGSFRIEDTSIDDNSTSAALALYFPLPASGVDNPNRSELIRSTVSRNDGTGVWVFDGQKLDVVNSTLSGNQGPGLYAYGSADVTISSSTVANNMDAGLQLDANGIAPTCTVTNTIVATNSECTLPDGKVMAGVGDLIGNFISGDNNLIGCQARDCGFNQLGDMTGEPGDPLDPHLGPLQDNGGPTETHELLVSIEVNAFKSLALSPAVDAGRCAGLKSDQRWRGSPPSGPRIVDDINTPNSEHSDGCDIGAYEAFANSIVLAVELISFDASVTDGDVELRWQTESESSNAGFEVHHAPLPTPYAPQTAWETVAFVEGSGTTKEPRSYSYSISGLDPGTHTFRLKQIDTDGSFAYSDELEVLVELPDVFIVEAAYPNPFNPTTTLTYAVATEQRVRVKLFDALGRQVRLLADRTAPAHELQTIRVDGAVLPTGMYLVQFDGAHFQATERVVLVR